MILLTLSFFFSAAEGLPFLSFVELKECPNIPAQQNVHIEQIAGSWRLAYLFYDERDDFVEDNTCIVAEFSPISNTQMQIDMYMDVREDDIVIDRSSFDLIASFRNPGEWLLHSNLSSKACIHVKVIALTKHHMILTFCISNKTDTENYGNNEDMGYNYILQKLRNDGNVKSFVKNVNKADQVDKELSTLFGRGSYLRRKRSFLEKLGESGGRGHFLNDDALESDVHNNDRHFWTIVLAKDNNVSAYSFIEIASLMMKFGFDLKNGNLVSFGKCNP